jgi:hypothetical protein
MGIGIGFDAYDYSAGQTSGLKVGADLAVDVAEVAGGGVGAILGGFYYAVGAFYPGGWPGALQDFSASANQNLQNGITDSGKISFHLERQAPDAIPDSKKPKTHDEVIDPYDLPRGPGKI